MSTNKQKIIVIAGIVLAIFSVYFFGIITTGIIFFYIALFFFLCGLIAVVFRALREMMEDVK